MHSGPFAPNPSTHTESGGEPTLTSVLQGKESRKLTSHDEAGVTPDAQLTAVIQTVRWTPV